MGIAKTQLTTKVMPFILRPLVELDVAQSAEVEREAFPNLFPPTSFRRELENPMARYLVACARDGLLQRETDTPQVPASSYESNSRPRLGRLLGNARSFWPGRRATSGSNQPLVAGFLGIWYMVDEAHIVSVAVRKDCRGRGIGELLLIGGIEQAMARGAREVTLEVRVSNSVAQNLYQKYGFKERGVRKAYYTDNGEDALIMTTDPIHLAPYPEEFRKLARAHAQRWGLADRLFF